MTDLPLISALVPAYNAERFVGEAVVSALDQDYPADRLEVIVVDDGSTDGTADVVRAIAARHPGRVRLIQQSNAGLVGAVNTALAAARGELLALLDADDVWPRSKTRAQVALLLSRPEVGLVYGDMCVIDSDGRVLQESWLEGDDPPEGPFSAPMLLGNSATASSIMMRASLGPIPPDVPFQDWWFMLRAAQVSEVAYLPEPRTLYRYHGANMSLGTSGDDRLRELRKCVVFQRRFLRALDPDVGTPAQLLAVWRAFERNAREALELSGSPFASLVAVTRADRREAAALCAEGCALLERGAPRAAIGPLLRAAACDPWSEEARDGVYAAAAACDPSLPGQRPLEGAALFVVRADACELLADPSLLVAFGRAMAGVEGVTLAIDASTLAPARAEEALRAVVADADDLDLLAVLGPLDAVGRARLATGTSAVYGAQPPAFTPDTLHDLRELAAGSGAPAVAAAR